jgi:quercetin dioxygenase-like cupin family protein
MEVHPMRFSSPLRRLTIAALLLSSAALASGITPAASEETGDNVTPVFSSKLPNVPGQSLTAILVTYGPGGKSGSHHHAGSVYAYVLTGAIRSENSATGPARVYKAGESFFEPPGSTHLISANASATEAASLLAIFVAEDGAKLTTFDR